MARTGEKRNAYRVFEEKTKRNESDGDNIKMHFKVCANMDWTYMALDRKTRRIIVDRVINFLFPQTAGNDFISLGIVNSSE